MSHESTAAPKPSSETITVESQDKADDSDAPTLRLRLTKPKHRKSVQWTETTIDNENLNKKKSKCCCIYVKPRSIEDMLNDDEEDDEDDDECENCHGHVEKKKHVHADKPVEDIGKA